VDGAGIEKYLPTPRATLSFEDFQPAEQVIESTGANVRFGGNRAFYSASHDFIQLPPKEAFASLANYYGVAFHELAHWTGHETRQARKSSYAFEELVAEIAGCYLATEIGVPQSEDLSNHHAYLASWLRELKSDSMALFKAATQASKATDYILSFSQKNAISQDNEASLMANVA
jgi:antirestriction protein ArdC